MTARVRALIGALVVLIAVAGGALYVAYRHGFDRDAQTGLSFNVATTGDIRDLIDSSGGDGEMVRLALRKLEAAYYEPVAPQTPLSGEENAIVKLLHEKRIKAQLPQEKATGDPFKDANSAASLLAYAQQRYGDDLGTDGSTQLTEAALSGMMSSVDDPYTVYLSPHEMQGLSESLSGGNFGGIGVYIYQLKDGEVVVQPISGMPAARSGMKPGDVVDTVNGRSIRGMNLDTVERLIRGPAGSHVTLTTHLYKRPGEQRYVITRAIIHVPTVNQKMEDGYDYIRLSDFGETSPAEVKKAILAGEAKHAKGYILDLRDNGGGLLDAAVKISSYFIPQGVIVSTVDRAGHSTEIEALGDALGNVQPLVVLVNKYTASASEITSGALQDYHLAKLIGTKTFGKGVVQSIYPMQDGGALKITTARYLTPAGRDIQHKGIEPDIVVQQSVDPSIIDTPRDRQLAAAKAELKKLRKSEVL
jgi:carboxyl-terminal processing protease